MANVNVVRRERVDGGNASDMNAADDKNFRTLLEYLHHKLGTEPNDAIGWLYVARGCYKIKRCDWCFSALCQPLGPLNDDNEAVRREAQHLMAFSLYKQKQIGESLNQFCKSVRYGNDHDWQMIVEISCAGK